MECAEKNQPITDVMIFSAKDELPPGYEVLTSTMFGAPAGLNRGLMALSGQLYVCFSREAPGPPLTDLILIFPDENEVCPAGMLYVGPIFACDEHGPRRCVPASSAL
jgi:hypothetical protein